MMAGGAFDRKIGTLRNRAKFGIEISETQMVKYYIDEMQGESVVALHVATGETAIEAVQKVASGPLVVRTSQTRWFRVVDERQSEVFKFAHVDRGNGRPQSVP